MRGKARAEIDDLPLHRCGGILLHVPQDVDEIAVDDGARIDPRIAQDRDDVISLSGQDQFSPDDDNVPFHLSLDRRRAADAHHVVVPHLPLRHVDVAEDTDGRLETRPSRARESQKGRHR